MTANRRKRIYVAGPYTNGDVALNVRAAITAGERLRRAGHAPYIPHLAHFWHLLFPNSWDSWMALDEAFIPCCDAVVRLNGASVGADLEVELARTLKIPVLTLEEAETWR